MKRGLLLCLLLCMGSLSIGQTVTIPDANFKAALIADGVDTNNDGEIQVSEAEAVTQMDVSNENISSLEGILSFNNLQKLDCSRNNLTVLNVTSLGSLQEINCVRNELTTLDISGLANLQILNSGANKLSSINLANLPSLLEFECQNNEITSLDLSGAPNLTAIFCRFNEITTLDVSMLSNLVTLWCARNELTSLNVLGLANLEDLNCALNNLTGLDLSGLNSLKKLSFENNQITSSNLVNLHTLSNLEQLWCSRNQLTSLDASALTRLKVLYSGSNELNSINVSNLQDLVYLRVEDNQLLNLDISGLNNLKDLDCGSNQLTSLDVSNQSKLEEIHCDNNRLTSLDISQNPLLENLHVEQNQLTSLDVSQTPLIWYLSISNNQITHLDISNLTSLLIFFCNDNLLNSLDVSQIVSLETFYCYNNLLERLIIKNGGWQGFTFDFSGNPTLLHICVDEHERDDIQNIVNSYGYSNCVVNTFCTFIPGGEVFYVRGNVQFDLNGNGCDSNDAGFGDLKLKVTNSQNVSDTYSTNADGSYNIALPEDSYTIEYVLENPSYFNVSPASYTVNFPADTSPYLQDFCLTANGVVQDLEIQVIPLELARPGFDAEYKIVYKNNGTSTVSGNITLTYDDNVMDLVSSTPNFTTSTPNFLSWDYTNLTPSETREIFVTMNLNSPMETPPLNGGEILCYDAAITPTTNDQRVNDNTFTLKQTVVNSYDPNDKTCLQGNTVTPDIIGEYVHYLIRFENTGTASAINVVVKDVIDTNKFDIATMVVYDSSHDMVTRIQNTNEVEFIFEGINLPFDDANNDGYILFKIKTLPSLAVGDTFENNAEIYFDFNFPIITNTEQTTIESTASIDDVFLNAQLRLFPNPTQDHFTIESSITFDSVTIYDLKGRQLKMISNTTPQLSNQIDIAALASGVYYASIQSGKSKKLIKFIRE